MTMTTLHRGDLLTLRNIEGQEVSLIFIDTVSVEAGKFSILFNPTKKSVVCFDADLYTMLDEGALIHVSPLHDLVTIESAKVMSIQKASDYRIILNTDRKDKLL